MANAPVNSAALVVGITDRDRRHNLTRYVYKVSRAMIGGELVQELRSPRGSTLGVSPWFRMQSK